MSIQEFFHNTTAKWIREEGADSDIVISTRVRIARNVAGLPFPLLATDEQSEQVVQKAMSILEKPNFQALGHFTLIRVDQMSEIERQVLVEKHLVSPDLATQKNAAVMLRQDEAISIMLNEEDHLRIQCILPGLQLEQAYQEANAIDDALEAELDFAFDEDKGYLTACPTNVGTGIRASVMMHLPSLTMSGQMNRIIGAISQVGLVVRGFYGEGSDTVGNIYQISNQLTLGQSEQEIIENLLAVTKQLMDHERNARSKLMRDSRDILEDRIWRSFGILSNARKIDSKETMQRLSDVRLGIDLGMIKGVSPSILKDVMILTRPAFLQTLTGQELTPDERDWRRASIIRDRLRSATE